MAHKITWETNGVSRNFSDALTPGEILKSNFTIYESPQFKNIKYIINDFRDVVSFSIESDDTKIYAETDDIISRTKGKLLIAIVATHHEHVALAKNYQKELTTQLFKCEIFKTLEDAQKWVTSALSTT